MALRSLRNYVVLALITLLSLVSINTYAQSNENINISVTPQLIEISATPGDSESNNVRLINNSDEPVRLEAEVRDILPEGEEGSYIPTEDRTTYSLSQWATITPDSAIIPAGGSQDFTVTLDFPENAEPGSHFATALFTTVPQANNAEGAGAQVQQELALPVLLAKVAGDITEEASVVEFKSTKDFWTNENPITFETRVENTGNVHFKPSGTIVIKNMFGKEVAKLPIEQKNVLPDSIRKLTTEWQDPGLRLGQYTADLSLVYGENDEIITASTDFVVFPYQTVVPAALIVIALLYILVRYRDRFSKAVRVLTGRD